MGDNKRREIIRKAEEILANYHTKSHQISKI